MCSLDLEDKLDRVYYRYNTKHPRNILGFTCGYSNQSISDIVHRLGLDSNLLNIKSKGKGAFQKSMLEKIEMLNEDDLRILSLDKLDNGCYSDIALCAQKILYARSHF